MGRPQGRVAGQNLFYVLPPEQGPGRSDRWWCLATPRSDSKTGSQHYIDIDLLSAVASQLSILLFSWMVVCLAHD